MSLLANFADFIIRGGPAMLALLACSIVAVAIVTERLLFFAQQHVDADELVRQLAQRIALDDLAGAIAVCAQNAGMLPKVLTFGLQRGERSRIDVVDALSIELRKQVGSLERHLAIIGTIAVIAPFVGLFGTVLGIIHAFDDIALKGNSSPAAVAAGVSEALITTAAGLFVAVTTVIFFNYRPNTGATVEAAVPGMCGAQYPSPGDATAQPYYPESARESGATGEVDVLVSLSPAGAVTAATIYRSSLNPSLDVAAIRAARESFYVPEIVACQAIAGSYAFHAGFASDGAKP